MKKKNDINNLLAEIEKIAEVEKCLTCQCLADTLREFDAVLKKQTVTDDIRDRFARVLERAKVTHNCLGCDPCLPVPVSNALAEMGGSAPVSVCGPVCKPSVPITLGFVKKPPVWPVEQGEYVVGAEASPVAIATLGNDDLPAIIAERVGLSNFAIMGKTHTENIGIEKIVKNAISNPHIRFLVLCGADTKGHAAGQSLVALKDNGVSQDRKIIGSKGQRPILKNLDLSEIEHFRAQVHLVNLIGTDDAGLISQQALFCIEKNPGKFDKTVSIKKAPHTEAREPARLILDPSGFFIIYPKKEENKIYLEHYKTDGTLNEVIYGADPVLIASTAVEQGLVSRLDHAAYLGRELEKAYLSLCYGFPYVQDSAPGNEQK
jgi:tetrahydromethanopterin S-methyltransferase subunit A